VRRAHGSGELGYFEDVLEGLAIGAVGLDAGGNVNRERKTAPAQPPQSGRLG
jgi:hypothetical protein